MLPILPFASHQSPNITLNWIIAVADLKEAIAAKLGQGGEWDNHLDPEFNQKDELLFDH